jgi:hypothetical protein
MCSIYVGALEVFKVQMPSKGWTNKICSTLKAKTQDKNKVLKKYLT